MNDLYFKLHEDLPVFGIFHKDKIILYTPGSIFTVEKMPIDELSFLLSHPDRVSNDKFRDNILKLLQKAREAVAAWQSNRNLPFLAESFTVHVGRECNSACSYCYSKNQSTGNQNITGFPDFKIINTVLRDVFESNDSRSNKITVVFHGSGEPAFHWQQLIDSYTKITAIAKEYDRSVFTYIATNGLLSEAQVDWLAENIDLIGISCDGPEIDKEEKRPYKMQPCLSVEVVCKRILEKGGRFDIRATITPDSVSKQLDIVKFLIEKCQATNIRFEPVYLMNGRGFEEYHAEIFFDNFIIAQKFAESVGVKLSYAGVRMEELHGTYCDISRQNIRLTPDGLIRNCFCYMKDEPGYITGYVNPTLPSLFMKPGINELKKKALRIPEECSDCIDAFHCSRGCPEYCIVAPEDSSNNTLNRFRCRLHELLTVERIKRMSEQLIFDNL